MPLHYTPASSGGWLAIVHEPRLLVVASPDDDFAAAAWLTIAAETGFEDLLNLLTSKGLAATPSFALVEWATQSSARVIVRGDATVTVSSGSGESTLAGASVSTWVESTIADAASLSVALAGAVGSAAALPLELGAALVAAIDVTASADAPNPSQGKATTETLAARLAAKPPTPPAEKVAAPVTPPEPAVAEPATVAPEPIDVGATIVVDLPPAAAEPVPAPAAKADPDGYDYLFGETMHRSVADAAVHVAEDDDESALASINDQAGDQPGDHDGQTVLTSDIAKLRRKRGARTASVDTAPPPAATLVLVQASGERESLEQPILVGRAPSVSQVSPGQLPRLLTLGSIDQDISRNHAQFALEGDTVVVTDLHSKNGTSIILPGMQPQKLRAGEPTSVIVGTVIDLGGGLTFTVQEETTA